MTSREEQKFIKRVKKYPDNFLLPTDDSVMEGFEYFSTAEYKNKPDAVQSRLKTMVSGHGLKGLIRLGKMFIKRLPSIKKNIKKNFTDLKPLLKAVEEGSELPTSSENYGRDYPNSLLWEELKEYAWNKHRVTLGFTELPREYIFEGKAVPFKYALIFAQEMQKEQIEKAPELDAGIEVIKVYNSLGIATNDIANWLREKGILCMANHPLGGLTDTVPLAEKAGLGAIGRNGLLITREFGPRCRLSPVFLEQKIFEFTDSEESSWVNQFCSMCGNCVKSCPAKAIYSEPKLSKKYYKSGLKNRMESYDREKCFTSFSATMGCGICISVCPFSKNPLIFDKMKVKYQDHKVG